MSIFDEFDEIERLFKKLRPIGSRGISSGYSISVTYGPDGRPIVKVETYGDVDKEKLRKEIERTYPGAKIIGLDEEPLIKEVTEEEKSRSAKKTEAKERRKPRVIWEDEKTKETKSRGRKIEVIWEDEER